MENTEVLNPVCRPDGNSVQSQIFVYSPVVPKPGTIPKYPDLGIQLCHISICIQVQPSHSNAVILRLMNLFNAGKKLLCILQGQIFIRIQKGNPLILRLFDGKILGRRKVVNPRKMTDLRSHPLCDLHSPICRTSVYYNLFRHNPLSPGKSFLDIFLFVFHDHTL